MARSQTGIVCRRRVGLAVRLADDEARGLPVPNKRIEPSLDGVGERRLKIIRKGRELSRLSFSADCVARTAGDDLLVHLDAMAEEIRVPKRIEAPCGRTRANRTIASAQIIEALSQV